MVGLKEAEVSKEIYWSPNDVLSFNRYLSMIIGARGIGKTYGIKQYLINRFLKTGEQFIYLRRYKSHLKGGVVANFFDKVKNEFPDVKFSVKGSNFFINGKVCGHAIPLSAWQNNKGTEFPNVHTIFYDEFLKEKDNSHYLDNEPQALLSMAESVFREKIIFGTSNVRIICASNSTTISNPFFLYFKSFPNIEKRFNTFSNNKEIVVEIPNQEAFSQMKLEGRFGELIKNTPYVDLSVDNNFAYDTDEFIKKRTSASKFKFSLTYQDFTLGVWIDLQENIMYLDSKYDIGNSKHYALTKNDFNQNRIFSGNKYKEHYELLRLVTAYKNGQLRFTNQTVRNIGYDVLNYFNIK